MGAARAGLGLGCGAGAALRGRANLFQPLFKLREKTCVRARVTKRRPRWPHRPWHRARLDARSTARIAELRGRADRVEISANLARRARS